MSKPPEDAPPAEAWTILQDALLYPDRATAEKVRQRQRQPEEWCVARVIVEPKEE